MLQKITESVPALIASGTIAFAIASHALAFVAQLFVDIKKDEPGWIKSITDVVAKVLDFLNGQKKA